MKICDRCFEEYSDAEFVKMDQFPDSFICIPCNYQFSNLYIDFLRGFLFNNQPERSKREDINKKGPGFKYDNPDVSDIYL